MEFLGDQNELAAADVLVFVREAVQRFEQLRVLIIAKMLEVFPTIKSMKWVSLSYICVGVCVYQDARGLPHHQVHEVSLIVLYMCGCVCVPRCSRSSPPSSPWSESHCLIYMCVCVPRCSRSSPPSSPWSESHCLIYVCVCVCVCQDARGLPHHQVHEVSLIVLYTCVCVCVCVCVCQDARGLPHHQVHEVSLIVLYTCVCVYQDARGLPHHQVHEVSHSLVCH